MTFTVRIESACGREPFVRSGVSADDVLTVVKIHLTRASRKLHVITITPEHDR